MADVIAALPAGDPFDSSLTDAHIRLLDTNGQTLYQWGEYQPAKNASPRVTHDLEPPRGAWRLTPTTES